VPVRPVEQLSGFVSAFGRKWTSERIVKSILTLILDYLPQAD